MKGKINKIKGSDGNYIYPLTVSEAVYVDPNTSLKDKLNEMDSERKPVSYMIDLTRWGLISTASEYNDKRIAMANSIGINAAIQWASEQGYTEVTLPKGNYLIDENNPIIPASYMTFNLGGSKLRIRNNSFSKYHIIDIKYQVNIRITNGIIEGDRDQHDYSNGGAHEGCLGINIGSNDIVDQLGNPEYIQLDHLEIFNCSGDSIGIGMAPNFQNGYNLKLWEQGSINPSNGAFITDAMKIRLANNLLLDNAAMTKYGYFSICGNGWGDFGSQIKTNTFDVIFYNNSAAFVASLRTIKFFDKITIPSGAAYAKLVLYQSNIPDPSITDSIVLSVGVPLYPRNIFVEKCNLHHSSRCGISSGGRYIYILNNNIHDISGTPPQAAIDIEDGYGLNQYYFIENNYIHDCKLGINLVSTQHVMITNNLMERLGPSQVWNKCMDVNINNNYFSRSGLTLDGEVMFTNNKIYLSGISSRKLAECVIGDNFFRNSSLNITKDIPHRVTVNNCIFYHDSDSSLISEQQPTIFFGKEPQSISNCVFEGKTSALNTLDGQNGAYDWKLTNNTFLNTKALRLPAGIISGCTFDYTAKLDLLNNSVYDFTDCLFKNWDDNNYIFTLAADQNVELLMFRNCRFIGNNKSAFFLRNIQGNLELVNNRFEYKNAESIFTIIDFWTATFTCRYLLIDGNEFISNIPLTAVNLNRQLTPNQILFRNNRLDTVIQPITSDVVYTSNNYINGVYEPYKNVTVLPTTGKYVLSDTLNNAAPVPGGYQGWVCTTAGYACEAVWGGKEYYNARDRIVVESHVYETLFPGNPSAKRPAFTGKQGEIVLDVNQELGAWMPNTSYSVGAAIIVSSLEGIYMKCTIAGTSSKVGPIWNTTPGQVTTDGTVTWTTNRLLTWKEIGNQAVFKPFGLISM